MEVVNENMASIFSNFVCGNEAIDRHFQRQDFGGNVRYAYMDRKKEKTAGLADIKCSGVNLIYDGKIVEMLPAVKIDHFAVAMDYQDVLYPGTDEDEHFYLSDMFLCDLIKKIRCISDHFVGVECVILNSVPDAVHFYARNLFEKFPSHMQIESNWYLENCVPMIFQL